MRDQASTNGAQPRSGGQRIAFFGGSFDPPHLGHLAVARAAREALHLDSVLFAPVGAQPLKAHGSTASFVDRVELTRLAIFGEPGFAVSLADAPKSSGAPNYTIDALLDVRAELPGDSILFCLMGADAFFGLRQWHRAAEIPFVAPLIVASRPDQQPDLLFADLKTALPAGLVIEAPSDFQAIPNSDEDEAGAEVSTYLLHNSLGQQAPLYILPGIDVEISASQIRDQLPGASAAPFEEQQLLPKVVFEAIRSRKLYR
jgi:nicotinate-nucleotide adenylyltransferase